MEALVLIATALGVALLAHRYQLRLPRLPARPALGEWLEPEAEVAISVAAHEAETRHQHLSALHVLYGLLQDEGFTTAITKLGGNPAAIEERVTTELDRARAPDPAEGALIVNRASAAARNDGRRATCTDLWVYAARTHTANLVEVGGITAHGLLFALVHGGAKPDASLAGQPRVDIVIRNDHYTTMEYVVAVLREVFPEADAVAVTQQTHEQGRGVVGRFDADEAKLRVERAQAHARNNGFPLWIGVEPF